MKRTALGLFCVEAGIVLIVAVVVALVFVNILWTTPPTNFGQYLAISYFLGLGISTLLVLAGRIQCLSVPVQSRARGFAYAALVLQSLAIVVHIFLCIWWGTSDWTPLGSVFLSTSAATIIATAAAFFFLLFMDRLAHYIGRDDMARSTRIAMATGCIAGLLALYAGVASTTEAITGERLAPLGFPSPVSAAVARLIAGCFLLVAFIAYANCVTALRQQLRQQLRQHESQIEAPSSQQAGCFHRLGEDSRK